ncbi:hypothetical protein B296_00055146 [Ensete ventricosum]|uniref:YqgF/RNase H-like domain-containing protein n=1 Tax=Ensete ventricosum TaxID=4639 RepID=A0A426X525_ENSVE|nr:hypothetical protein B296_00055146 [Ensete ventricosum]
MAAPPRPPFGSLSSYSSLRFGGKIRVRVGVNARYSASSSATDEEFLPNARRRKIDPTWCGGGFSLGVDLGASRTGLALGKGYSPRPLIEVDEFIIGLPKSHDGKETPQSNKVRSIAGRLAVRAAEGVHRNQNSQKNIKFCFGCKPLALHKISDGSLLSFRGLKRSARGGKIDAYSAMMVLERYFSMSGVGTELVLPKQLELHEKLRKGPCRDLGF